VTAPSSLTGPPEPAIVTVGAVHGTPDPTLRVEGLVKSFGEARAVDDVSFDVGTDEVLCLVGPSGCGKSTVLRMVAGLVRPDRGRVSLHGRVLDADGVHVPPERRGIGIVFQDHALFPNLDVTGNVAFGLNRLDRQARRDRTAAMLELVGLAGHAGRYPHELSGGERQRVALARALAPEPAVLLLDEPFASLDQNLRVRVRDEVLAILRTTGTPAVFVTHDQLEALSLGDRLVVLRGGAVEQTGTPQQVFHTPASRFVATFMGDADFVPATVTGGVVRTELGERVGVPDRSGALEMVVRPDDVTFVPDHDGQGVVTRVEFHGSSVLATVLLDSGVVVRSRRPHALDVAVGARVRVALADHHRVPVLLPVEEA
jgi:iron(III) transport system ATP-binding protein